MRRVILALLLLTVPASLYAQAPSVADHIHKAQAELEAAEQLLVPPGPVYTSLSDHTIKPKPAPPALGPAGYRFTDPTFGSPMWRVTDATTSEGRPIRVPSSAHATAWNSTGTKFYGVNDGGGTIVFNFDGANVTRTAASVPSQIEPSFSLVDPFVIYGGQHLSTSHKIRAWRLDTNTVTDVLDFESAYPTLPLRDTYIGGVLLADGDILATHFGGKGIDQHVFVHHSRAGLLDVRGRGWFIHAISIDRTGRWVLVYPAVDPNTGRLPGCPGPTCVAQVWIWDTQTRGLAPMTEHPAGHGAMGYGQFVNQDCCTSGTWDASQWQIRNLATPTQTRDLIPAVLTPQHVYDSEHTNWRAARQDANVPIVSASYRFGDGLSQAWYPWRAWDEEIIAIATDGSGNVWRFAHHQSLACTSAGCDFWSEPMLNCAPDGRHCAFTSNWGHAGGRQDIFLVELK